MLKSIKNPQELMQFLDNNIQYGVIDKTGNKLFDSNSDKFQQACFEDWTLRSPEQIISNQVGHCYDQVEIERAWFKLNNYEFKTFWISAYQPTIDNSGFSHTYLVYKQGSKWYLFEHADYSNKGIFEFLELNDAVKWQANNQIKYATGVIKPKFAYEVCIKEYDTPPLNINMQQYLQYIEQSKDYNI